jgi:hypothetical protein
MLRGRPITGAIYIREKFGPVPRPLVPIRQELVRERAIRVWKDRHYDRSVTRFQALRAPDNLTIFDREDLQTVDWWIEHIDKNHTAGSISEESHDYAWEIARMGEELPYHAIFATRMRVPDKEEMEWARRRAKELGLAEVRTIREEPAAQRSLDAALQRWARASDAWDAAIWIIARDPQAGEPVTESGITRAYTFEGARSIDLPTVTLLYELRAELIVVHDAFCRCSARTGWTRINSSYPVLRRSG